MTTKIPQQYQSLKTKLETIVKKTIEDTSDDILDLVYPVGSIYMSVNSTSPATLFGGTWQQLQNRFLIGAGDIYSNGATGGATTVTLTTDQIPSHIHQTGYRSVYPSTGNATALVGYANSASSGTSSTSSTGSGNSHDNMPPYLAVYIWKRVT